jgi:X-X-X-Leu-X-X-Gly heptad repeat protein
MSNPIARINGGFPVVGRLALSAIAAATITTHAVEFENDVIEGNFDTTLSYGGSFRTSAADPGNIGIANGGTRYSVNGDDANLNYGTGLFSHVAKGTHDLEVDFKKLQDVSLFLRGTYFVDFENIRGDSPLSDAAKREVGRDMELLDAYISYDLPTSIPVNIRLGNQVLSWGESTFIQNGINVINPIDVTKFRIPGSELREALRPVPLLSVSLQATDNLTLEGFYQFKQEEMEIDPAGSYFSTKDFVGPGGQYAMLGFGSTGQPNMESFTDNPLYGLLEGEPDRVPTISNPRFNPALPPSEANAPFLPSGAAAIPRGQTNRASDSGQFGFAARYFAEGLNDTEFGFYFINYHSRLPVISAMTGRNIPGELQLTVDALTAGIGQLDGGLAQVAGGLTQAEAGLAQVNGAIAQLEAADPNSPALVGLKTQQATIVGQKAGLLAQQTNLTAQRAGYVQNRDGLKANIPKLAGLYPGTARYIFEYPEDIQLFGVSFNTEIGATGISLQGEVSYRRDVPLQVDDIELLIAGLTPTDPTGGLAYMTQLGGQDFNSYVQGYRRFEVWQPQFTVTKLFGPTLGASQWVLVGEAAATVVPDLPSKDVLRFDGPGTALSGNRLAPGLPGHAPYSESADAFADDFSWGYRLAARIDYMDVIGGVNLSPAIVFSHDVDGNTPLPLGNFLHDRKSVTVGVTATYQNSWQGTVKYTEFLGNEDYNLMYDRDFLQAMVQYSF